MAIYMETRADWIIAAQACWRHNITIVTVYATLGEEAVADASLESRLSLSPFEQLSYPELLQWAALNCFLLLLLLPDLL